MSLQGIAIARKSCGNSGDEVVSSDHYNIVLLTSFAHSNTTPLRLPITSILWICFTSRPKCSIIVLTKKEDAMQDFDKPEDLFKAPEDFFKDAQKKMQNFKGILPAAIAGIVIIAAISRGV